MPTLKHYLLIIILFAGPVVLCSGQINRYSEAAFDSLEEIYWKGDSSTVKFLETAITQAKENKDEILEARARYCLGKYILLHSFNYPDAYREIFSALLVYDKANMKKEMGKCEMQIGMIYYMLRDYAVSRDHFFTAYNYMRQTPDSTRQGRLAYLLSLSLSELNKFDEAWKYLEIHSRYIHLDEITNMEHNYSLGVYYLNKGEGDSALLFLLPNIKNFYDTLSSADNTNIPSTVPQIYAEKIARVYWLKKDYKKSEELALSVIKHGRNYNTENTFLAAYKLLNLLSLRKNDYRSAENYLKQYTNLKDSLVNEQNLFEISSQSTKFYLEQQKQKAELQEAVMQSDIARQRGIKNILFTVLFFSLAFAVFLGYNNSQRKKKNQELADSLAKLKATQEQLVHNEKLASMGRLSASIAHEMRNPLNFVNGFSEVTSEMLNDLELVTSEQERKSIIHSMKDNIGKINEHGKRAEKIVKQIIEHVHTSKGIRELSNFNQLCENYLKIVLHTMSMNKIGFNPQVKKDFSENLPLISVNQQEFGRVLMNVFSNAFQALEEKSELVRFNPEIIIRTAFINKQLSISVTDNGIGIKQELLGKIGEPFFTTRAPGNGAGLGLSVAFDIVRAYGGQITAESVPMEYTNINIRIPV